MWAAVLIHSSIVALAIIIQDISVIFEFAGTIGCTFIAYFFPAIGYLLALSKYGTDRTYAKWQTTGYRVTAWLFILIGSLAVASYFYTVGLKISGKIKIEDGPF